MPGQRGKQSYADCVEQAVAFLVVVRGRKPVVVGRVLQSSAGLGCVLQAPASLEDEDEGEVQD